MTGRQEHNWVLAEKRQQTYWKADRQLHCQSSTARLQTLTCVSLRGLLVCSMVLRLMLAPLLSTRVMVRFTGWIPLRGIVCKICLQPACSPCEPMAGRPSQRMPVTCQGTLQLT